jgi:hypothetical protein
MDHFPPKRYRHVELKAKRQQKCSEELNRIEKENHLLVAKMYVILHADDTARAVPFKPGVRIDRGQTPLVDCYQSKNTAYAGQAATNLHILSNRARRKMHRRQQDELLRANRLARRCMDVKPAYSVKEWEKSARKNKGAQTPLQSLAFLPVG